jgi:hypothetical protein
MIAIGLRTLILNETITATTGTGIAPVLIGVALTRRRVKRTSAEQEKGSDDPAVHKAQRNKHAQAARSASRRQAENKVPQDRPSFA